MSVRQSGRTTLQMLEAPKDAIFVWPNNQLGYPRDLAMYLGRSDLRCVAPDFLEYRSVLTLRKHHIVCDHDTVLSPRQYDVLQEVLRYRNLMVGPKCSS